jgi:hypothetical protein
MISNSSTQFPYDFQFQRVYHEPKNYPFLSTEIPPENYHQMTAASPSTNGSLFGIPRLPPKQSSYQSPSWNSITTIPMLTPRRHSRLPTTSPSPSTVVTNDSRWKEEFIERMQSYETHIQSLTTLVTQLLTNQQISISTPMRECIKCDVAIQSEPSSPCINDESSSITNSHRYNPQSPKIERCQQQTPIINITNRVCSFNLRYFSLILFIF